MSDLTLYGIPACDTMKKARTWLDEHSKTYAFHNYKKDAIDQAHLERWCNEHGWEKVLNRAGTTFRKLDDASKADDYILGTDFYQKLPLGPAVFGAHRYT